MVTGRVDGGPEVRAWIIEGISATVFVVSWMVVRDGGDGTHRDLP